uniref:Uncharacterized protein n=1 Tax=Glossina austeni TaxID=7395 RepID=A0A1A9VC54_GLOAU
MARLLVADSVDTNSSIALFAFALLLPVGLNAFLPVSESIQRAVCSAEQMHDTDISEILLYPGANAAQRQMLVGTVAQRHQNQRTPSLKGAQQCTTMRFNAFALRCKYMSVTFRLTIEAGKKLKMSNRQPACLVGHFKALNKKSIFRSWKIISELTLTRAYIVFDGCVTESLTKWCLKMSAM